MYKKNKDKGFTLIEVMIVVAILGIISAIALPSYAEYVRKGKRADAKVELLRIAQLQESYFVQNLSYASTLAQLGLAGIVTSEQEEYTMTIVESPTNCDGITGGTNIACTGFTLDAAGNGGQANDKCGNFTLTNTGAKEVPNAISGYDVKKCWK